MLKNKGTLSIILKIFLYGVINLVLVLGLISVTKFNSKGSIQEQLLEVCIIVFVTGLVDYIVINKKI